MSPYRTPAPQPPRRTCESCDCFIEWNRCRTRFYVKPTCVLSKRPSVEALWANHDGQCTGWVPKGFAAFVQARREYDDATAELRAVVLPASFALIAIALLIFL